MEADLLSNDLEANIYHSERASEHWEAINHTNELSKYTSRNSSCKRHTHALLLSFITESLGFISRNIYEI
jgi:hypothetical protein